MMKDDEVRLRLTIDVHYELGRTNVRDLERVLVAAADHLAGNGMLSGETEASVLTWDSAVSTPNSIVDRNANNK
jgi:hypothetical protein